MNDILQSIRSDLLSRRLLPVLVLLLVLLVVAIGYALESGSSSSPSGPSIATGAAAVSTTKSISVEVASSDPNQAVSETPAGANYQSKSPTRDPFTPLPEPASAKTSSSSGSSSSSNSSSASANSAGSAGGSGGSTSGSSPSPKPSSGSSGGSALSPSAPSKPSSPAKSEESQSSYTITVQFGPTPVTSGEASGLTSYTNLKPQSPLPSKHNARIVFERVSSSGKGAIFKFVLPPILHGGGHCLPNNSECEALELSVGQSEELEYAEANGQVVVYQLKLLSIANGGASAARAARARPQG